MYRYVLPSLFPNEAAVNTYKNESSFESSLFIYVPGRGIEDCS
jgi:hypothetical protein